MTTHGLYRIDIRCSDHGHLSERAQGMLEPYLAAPFPRVAGAFTYVMPKDRWRAIIAVMQEDGPVRPISRDELRHLWRAD